MNQNQINFGEEMLDEYDFSNGIRGKYVNRFKEDSNVIILDPDVAEIFNDSESVNNALRSIVHFLKFFLKGAKTPPCRKSTNN